MHQNLANAFTVNAYGPDHIEDIRLLWQLLNEHHAHVSAHFKHNFITGSFDTRKAYFLDKAAKGTLCIFMAEAEQRKLGFLVVSHAATGEGAIESLFVREEFRRMKIGGTLMRTALNWLEDRGANPLSISVVHGNEAAHPFYAKFGFLPRSCLLTR